MANETISIVYEPLGVFHGVTYYHETLLYTNSDGDQFMATAAPSSQPAPGTGDLDNISNASGAAMTNGQSPYGTLITNTGALSSFDPADVSRLLGSTANPNPSQVVASGADLSTKWNQIVSAENELATENLPYSPLTQNSNSIANTALTAAGIDTPLNDGVLGKYWTPASSNILRGAFIPSPRNPFPFVGSRCDAAYAAAVAAEARRRRAPLLQGRRVAVDQEHRLPRPDLVHPDPPVPDLHEP